MLHPSGLLQYAGYGVWNVHAKNGSKRPPAEWLIVEDAHPALITEEEARAIAAARQRSRPRRLDVGYERSRASPYLLSGGLFQCERCGSNMTGIRKGSGYRYYVFGSQPYRRGMGCGPGVYVPQEEIEAEVVGGLSQLLGVCADPKGFTCQVNDEPRRIWEESNGYDPGAASRLADIAAKVANIRRATQDGLSDAGWANERLGELSEERAALAAVPALSSEPPQLDVAAVMAHRNRADKVLAQGDASERKTILRTWVEEVKLAPERMEVEMAYRIRESLLVHEMVAGGGFEPPTFGL